MYPYNDMTVAPDGSIFVAINRQHHIYKFDKQGNLLKKFGRKGQGPGMSRSVENFFGEVYIAQTIEGNLAVGISKQREIKIYSPEGEVIHSFDLKINPIPVDRKYIKKYKDVILEDLKKKGEKTMNRTEKFWYDLDMKVLPTYDFSTIFDKHLPLYYEILVDKDGNFLVFRYTDCLKDCKTYFQVYSKTGEFICETELDKGNYDFEIDKRFKNICFTDEGVFGLFMNKGDADEIIRLVKSKFLSPLGRGRNASYQAPPAQIRG